jgi:phosphoserine aminotransferase
VIIKNDLLENINENIPSMMNYKIHADKSSMFNTPPVFSVYVSLLNMRWLKKMGGVSEIEKNNRKKAQLLYSEIDLNPLFKGHSKIKDRSIMNATFNLSDDNFKETFESMLSDANITALAGHRSVGGYRASMYNAMSLDSVKILVEVMSELESKI